MSQHGKSVNNMESPLLKSMSFKTVSYINYELEIWVALDSVIVTRLVTQSQ